jgi:hypothetical protein
MNQGMNYLWPTPIMKDKINNTDLLNKVVDQILVTTELDDLSNNFQRYDPFRDDQSDIIQEFKTSIVIPAFEKFMQIETIPGYKSCHVKSWVSGSKAGYVLHPHNHSGASLSGVFYLMFEETDVGGEILFQDPRFNANRAYQENFNKWFDDLTIMPATGDILIFPSYLYHYTSMFTGLIRLALAVDFIPVFDKSPTQMQTQYP